MTAHRFFLLGSLEILADGRPLLNPPTVKSQGLLAYLLLQRSRLSPLETGGSTCQTGEEDELGHPYTAR